MLCVVGCDIGTMNAKAVAHDVDTGGILASASSFEYAPVSPALKSSGQNSDVWMRTCFEAIKDTTEFLRRKGAERKSPKEDDFVVADHIALLVPDRRIVHQVAEVLQKVGFRPLFAPEEHPEFDPGYYSVSFCDPDNNVIECYTKIEQSSAHVQ